MATPTSSVSSPAMRRQRTLPNVGLSVAAKSTATQWGSFVAPPLPKCAEGRPQHLKDWRIKSKTDRHQRKLEELDFGDRHGCGGDVQGFRALLRHKFGNAARGWRLYFAPHGDHECHDQSRAGVKATLYSDFCRGLKSIGFAGNGKSLFARLCKDLKRRDTVTVIESFEVHGYELKTGLTGVVRNIDADGDALIDFFSDGSDGEATSEWVSKRDLAKLQRKGFNQAWLEDLDANLAHSLDAIAGGIFDSFAGGTQQAWKDIEREHAARCTADEFDSFLFDREVLASEAKVSVRQVFECLAISGRGNLTLEEFRFLDHWAARRLRRALPELVETKSRWAEEPPHWSPPPPKPPHIPDLKDFREFLEQKFGSPGRAWRVALDIKSIGTLSPSEFGSACRQMGWNHPHMELWSELASEGGGMVNLRGLDPTTCAAMDTLSERMTANFGDLANMWHSVCDPNGDGICSRAEWVRGISRDIGLSGKAAGLIFTILDNVHAGWISFSEIGFFEDFIFESAAAEADMDMTDVTGKNMFASMSVGSLDSQTNAPFGMTELSWADSSLEGSVGAGMRRSKSSTHGLHIGSLQRSSRSVQNRQYANCHMAKYRWMGQAAAEHSHNMGRKMEMPEMPTVGGTPLSDVFRFTNEFYREGCRRLEVHHKAQLSSLEKKNAGSESPASSPSRQSPASSGHRNRLKSQ